LTGSADVPARSIGDAIRRARAYLARRPEKARSTDTAAIARLEGGLRCRVEGPGGAAVVTDMSTGVGGRGSAPSPGWLLRASHAACDATLIAMRAADLGIELARLEVVVDSESDDRGLLGVDDSVPPGPLRTRVRVSIAAPRVPESQLCAIVDWAHRHSPVDDAVARAVPIAFHVTSD
jgi:uncharacterized OsmC-like protein